MSEATAHVHFHSSEDMSEVKTASVKLFMAPSVFLGKGLDWTNYSDLYLKVYIENGNRVLRKDGLLLVIQTNAYEDGEFNCRYSHLHKLMHKARFELVDERVWKRRAADHFQVPFSHVLVYRPPGGTVKRNEMNKRSKFWFQGVWDYPQSQSIAKEKNSYPRNLCSMIIKATTEEGDLVVDPFAGGGLLLGTAARMGRPAVGYEIDLDLVETVRENNCHAHVKNKVLAPKKRGLVD